MEEIFRGEVCVGEGYEYHLGAGLGLRTLWVQEGVVGTHLVVGGEGESGSSADGEGEGGEGRGMEIVRVQGGG